MPRQRLSHDERRRQIIDTTLACLARSGPDGTSLRSVCRELGVAPSLVKHFFEGWHDLLIAAYARLTENFMAQLTPIVLGPFPTERARMNALVQRYLSTDWAGENTMGANIALWYLARSVEDLKPHFSRFLKDRTKLLRSAIGSLAAEEGVSIEAGELTSCFILMLDGIWLELSINPGNVSQKRASQLCWYWLDAALKPRDAGTPPVAKVPRRAGRSTA